MIASVLTISSRWCFRQQIITCCTAATAVIIIIFAVTATIIKTVIIIVADIITITAAATTVLIVDAAIFTVFPIDCDFSILLYFAFIVQIIFKMTICTRKFIFVMIRVAGIAFDNSVRFSWVGAEQPQATFLHK